MIVQRHTPPADRSIRETGLLMTTNKNNQTNQVVDFNEARAQKLDEKKRKAERIFFKQLLGVYSVVGDHSMRQIELLEVSDDGLSFQVPFNSKDPWPSDMTELPLRLYFSQDTYIPVHLRIQNARQSIQDGTRYVRYGCSVDKEVSSYPAYLQFVSFLRAYSEHAHRDKGDVTIFYL